MNSQNLIESIVENFYDDEGQSITYLAVSKNLIESKVLNNSDVISIDLRKEKTPLAPFLNILSHLEISDEVLKNECYSLQYETFRSFFKDGFPAERRDHVILEEIDYEKDRICKTIAGLFHSCFDKKVIVYNAQCLSFDALKILDELEKSLKKGKIIFCFNTLEMDSVSSVKKEFFQELSKKENYFLINEDTDFCEIEVEDYKEHKVKDYTKLYLQIKLYRIFLDIEKAYEIIKRIDSSDILEKASIEETRKLYIEMGIIAFYHGDTDMATYYLTSLIDFQVDDDGDCYAYYFLSHVFSRKNMNTVALKYVLKAIEKSKKYEDQPIYALSVMMEYIISERTDSEYSTKKYFNALDLLDKNNLINNRIYTSLVVPFGVIYNQEFRREMLPQIQKAMQAAKKIDNKFGLSIACHWLGIIMTHEGDKENAQQWYKKCLKLRKEIDDFSSLLKVINGLSYEYLIDTKYYQSYKIINDVIYNLYENKDFSEIIITLYNLARTCFYSHNFEVAMQLVQTILNFFGLFDFSDLSVNSFLPSYNDVLVYKAALDFFHGDFVRAKMNLYNLLNNRKPYSQVEEYVKFFLEDCFLLEDGNKDEAIKAVEKLVDDFINKDKIPQEHRVVFMVYEFANLLNKKGYANDAKQILKRVSEIAKSKKLIYFLKDNELISLEEYLNGIKKFPPLKINLSELEQKAEKERLLNQLHKQLRNSQFLNKLSNNNAQSFNDTRFFANIVQSVFDYTMADAVFLSEKKDDEWVLLEASERENVKHPTSDTWEKFFQGRKSTGFVQQKNKKGQVLFVNLSRFEFTGGMIIYLQEKLSLSAEELNILNIASSNIQAQLVMLKQNEHLALISATDPLSMLNNRRALTNYLKVEGEMICRCEKKRSVQMCDTISFIDLDNFKYYNDTFGHEAGDLLISSFGKLLKQIYRKVDFISRFGGDEFVIVLPNSNTEEAKNAANRLYEELVKKGHFIPKLEDFLNKKICIPEDKKLRFSMGISSNFDEENISDLTLTLQNADKAMYYSKLKNKGSATVWADIKTEFSKDKSLESFNR